MSLPARFPRLRRLPRRAVALSVLLLLAFLAFGCQADPHGLSTLSLPGRAPARAAGGSACDEGLIAAQAWDCLSSGIRGRAPAPGADLR